MQLLETFSNKAGEMLKKKKGTDAASADQGLPDKIQFECMMENSIHCSAQHEWQQ
jgi:hypothetical protein